MCSLYASRWECGTQRVICAEGKHWNKLQVVKDLSYVKCTQLDFRLPSFIFDGTESGPFALLFDFHRASLLKQSRVYRKWITTWLCILSLNFAFGWYFLFSRTNLYFACTLVFTIRFFYFFTFAFPFASQPEQPKLKRAKQTFGCHRTRGLKVDFSEIQDYSTTCHWVKREKTKQADCLMTGEGGKWNKHHLLVGEGKNKCRK